MNKLREAAEMALEALENVFGKGKRCEAAITALRQALAAKDECETCANKRKKLTEAGLLKSPLRQALAQDHDFDRTASHMAGEYVDTNWDTSDMAHRTGGLSVEQGVDCGEAGHDEKRCGNSRCITKPTAPPSKPWVSLTDGELVKSVRQLGWGQSDFDVSEILEVTRAIEAKLKEKNHG